MKTIVINLPYRTDRLKTFNENNSIEYELYQAVDGKSISYERLKEQGYDVNHNWTDPILGTTLTKGEVGCFLSHWQIWNKCIEKNESIIVLEDDAILTDRFDMEEIESLPYDFVYLAYKKWERGNKLMIHSQNQYIHIGL